MMTKAAEGGGSQGWYISFLSIRGFLNFRNSHGVTFKAIAKRIKEYEMVTPR